MRIRDNFTIIHQTLPVVLKKTFYKVISQHNINEQQLITTGDQICTYKTVIICYSPRTSFSLCNDTLYEPWYHTNVTCAIDQHVSVIGTVTISVLISFLVLLDHHSHRSWSRRSSTSARPRRSLGRCGSGLRIVKCSSRE